VAIQLNASCFGEGGGTAIYDVTNWRLVSQDQQRVVYRPGLQTLANRLRWTIAATIVAVCLYLGYQRMDQMLSNWHTPASTNANPLQSEVENVTREMEEAFQRTMSAAEWEAFEQKLAESRREAKAEVEARERRFRQVIAGCKVFLLGGTGLFLFLGVLTPLSCLWSRVSIEADFQRNLVVRKWGLLFPVSRSWPISMFRYIGIVAGNTFPGVRGGRISAQWDWRVRLTPAPHSPQQQTPLADLDNFTPPAVEFRVFRHQHRPQPGQLPAPVADFVVALQRITGLSYGEPVIMETSPMGSRGAMRTVVRESRPVVTKHTFRSMEQVPEVLRSHIEEMMAAAREQGTPQTSRIEMTTDLVSGTITYRDAKGNVHTYRSAEEMPPEVRAIFERARRFPPGP